MAQSFKGLSNPQIAINNQTQAIMPNSVEFTTGQGEVTIRPQSLGGDSVSLVVTVNAETRMSTFKCSYLNTEEHMRNIFDFRRNPGDNQITLTDGDFVIAFNNASITNEPDIQLSESGEISVEWAASPVEF